jgi:hypothetical protein
MFERPFEVLEREYNRVWEAQDPLTAFGRLSGVTGGSLVFEPTQPTVLTLDHKFAAAKDEVMAAHLYQQLSVKLVDLYGEHVERPVQPGRIKVEEVSELRAA